jgi:hypothetical protein
MRVTGSRVASSRPFLGRLCLPLMVLSPRVSESIELVKLLRRVRWRIELPQEPLDDMLLDEIERIVRMLRPDALR